MTTPTNVISAGTSTAASSFAPNFSSAVAIGDTLVVGVMIDGGTATISSIADSQGNTWTVTDHHSGGTGNDSVVAVCNVTTALSTSDTFTVTCTSNFSACTVRVDDFAGVTYAPVGTPTIQALPNQATQTVSCTTTAVQDCWCWFGQFQSSAGLGSTLSGFTATAVRVTTTVSNSAISGYLTSSGSGTQTATMAWGASHTGLALAMVLTASSTAVSGDASSTATLTQSATASLSRSGSASQIETVTGTAVANLAASLAASQAVTVSQSATMTKSKAGSASQAVTVTSTASVTLETTVDASQTITVTQSATHSVPALSTPGPVTNLSNASTSRAVEALALVRGAQIRHGLDVLDTSDVPTGESLRFSTGSVTWSYRPPDPLDGQQNATTAVRRQASLTIPGDTTLNLLARRIRLWTEWRLSDGSWARWNLGVFASPMPTLADDGILLTRTLSMADKTYLWSQTTLVDPVHLDDTEAAIPWVIADLGTRFSETKFAITGDSTATVGGNGLTFDSGIDLLSLYSTVLRSVGNDDLTTDENGIASSQPLSVLAGKGISATYGPGQLKIVPAGSVEPLIPNVPNVIRFVARQGPASGGSEGNGIYTVTNQSTGPASVDARGFEVSLTVTVDAVDEITLESVGDSEKQRYFAGGGDKFTGSIALNPTFGERDVIGIVLPRLGILDGDWLVTSWSYPLQPITDSSAVLMPITAERRVT